VIIAPSGVLAVSTMMVGFVAGFASLCPDGLF